MGTYCKHRSLLVEGTLPDVRSSSYSGCTLPTSSFAAIGFGRFLRFTFKDYYGHNGSGLNYMTWKFVR